MSDYASLTDEELQQENYQLMAAIKEAQDKQDAIRAVLNSRVASAKAADVLEGLTPEQRDVLIEAAVAQREGS